MATYFHGSSEIQADGLQTFYLMNPNYVGHSDTQPPASLLFMNPATTENGLNPGSVSHAPPPHSQHFAGISLQAAATNVGWPNSDDPGRLSAHTQHEILALHGVIPRSQYNLGASADQSAIKNHPNPASVMVACHPGGTAVEFRAPVLSASQQGLSLSLSTQQPVGYRPSHTMDHEIPVFGVVSAGNGENLQGSASGGSSSSVSVASSGITGLHSVMLSSKYLRSAQHLLDEVVNVGKGIKTDPVEGIEEKEKMSKETTIVSCDAEYDASSGGGSGTKHGAELTTAQRQKLRMKKAKLTSMLDEVEQRYRQYHQQMLVVVASFEQVAGLGSAKSYTQLALQRISKQFRCLKNAITAQIKATAKSLGEEDSLEGRIEGSRLKFVDHHFQKQKALQQLGLVQHNPWRPQRGLPANAVSVLRAWLFEHFLHPYPKDSAKLLLAKQTGLTKSQVSNWFINARVRLWKPMVEEMYLEEMKQQEESGTQENTNKNDPQIEPASKSTPQESCGINQMNGTNKQTINQNTSLTEVSSSIVATSPTGVFCHARASFSRRGPSTSSAMQNSPSSILSMDMDMKSGETDKGIGEKPGTERQSTDSMNYMLMANRTNHGNGFSSYPMEELGMFNPEQLGTGFHGNGVSLTLGLPHCENISLSGSQQNYFSNQNIQWATMGTTRTTYSGINTPQSPHSHTSYDNIIQNRNSFVAQLLPDFVA